MHEAEPGISREIVPNSTTFRKARRKGLATARSLPPHTSMAWTRGGARSSRARALAVLLTLPAARALTAAAADAATRRWIDRVVIGERLCPWAAPASPRILVVREPSLPLLEEEAALLLAARPLSTTLVVCCDDSLRIDARSFGRLFTSLQAGCDVGPGVELLAFHPTRSDAGPGCAAGDPTDAGHYSVRSPLPTIQLLRSDDLEASREAYAATRVPGAAIARARHPRAPGALALLLENKRRLRSLGAPLLQRLLDACFETAAEPPRGVETSHSELGDDVDVL